MQRDEEASSDLGGRAFQNLVEANCRVSPDSPKKNDTVRFQRDYRFYDRCAFRYQCPE